MRIYGTDFDEKWLNEMADQANTNLVTIVNTMGADWDNAPKHAIWLRDAECEEIEAWVLAIVKGIEDEDEYDYVRDWDFDVEARWTILPRTKARYYAMPLWDLRPSEYEDEVGEIEEDVIEVPVYEDGDANKDKIAICDVTVVAPRGYILTDKDHVRIEELVQE